MKKIGITTFYNAYNYGAFLQCFALQEVLNDHNYEISIIDYTNKKIKRDYKIIKTNNAKKFIKSIVFCKKNIKRKKAFNECIKDKIRLTKINNKYDIIISGSDQIWNPNLTDGFDEVFTLKKFSNLKKISYASSVGEEKLIRKYKDEYISFLKDIDYVSVREESAKKELDNIIKKDITVTLDPTLLLSKEMWEKYIIDSSSQINGIFSYFVAVTEDNYKCLEEMSKLLKMKVISYSENPKEKNILMKCYTDNPFQFISRIKNSSFIFTSSFHATVFSIIFNKDFITMPPKNKGNRIVNLLVKLGLEDRIINNITELKKFKFDKKIDYDKVNKKLKKLREESLEWLYDAIGD